MGITVHFTVGDTGAGRHHLDFTSFNDTLITHIITMSELSGQGNTDDFHIAVWVLAKALTTDDIIIVDDAQGTKAHALRIVIIGKAKGVFTFQPTVIGVTTGIGSMVSCFHIITLLDVCVLIMLVSIG